MNDAPAAAAPAAEQVTVTLADGGTETFVAPLPSRSAADRTAQAAALYTAWRNTYLGGLPVDVFSRIEGASSFLIAAIAAAL